MIYNNDKNIFSNIVKDIVGLEIHAIITLQFKEDFSFTEKSSCMCAQHGQQLGGESPLRAW